MATPADTTPADAIPADAAPEVVCLTGDEFLARRLAPRIGGHIDVDEVLRGITTGLTAARDRSEMVAAARRAAATIVDEPNVDSLAERIARDAMASRTDNLARTEGLAYGLRYYFGDQLAVYVNKIIRGAVRGMPPGIARPRFAVTGITFYAAVLVMQGHQGPAPNAYIVEVHCGRSGFTPRSRRSPAISLCLKVEPSWSGERVAAEFDVRRPKMLRNKAANAPRLKSLVFPEAGRLRPAH